MSASEPKPSRAAGSRVGDWALAQRLARELEGEVRFDPFTRGRYATDASIYQIEPIGVVVPRSEADVVPHIDDRGRGRGAGAAARRRHLAMRPDGRRGAGGRCEPPPQPPSRARPGGAPRRGRARHRARPAQRCCNRTGSSSRSTSRPRAAPRSAAWPATTAAARARSATATCATTCARSRRRSPTAVPCALPSSARRSRGRARVPKSARWSPRLLGLGRARGRRDRRALPQGAAPGRRLQHRRAGAARRQARPINLAHLLVGSEGTLAFSRRIELQLCPIPEHKRARRLPFPDASIRRWHRPSASSSSAPVAVELVDRTMIELARGNPALPADDRCLRARRARGAPAGRVRRRRARAAAEALGRRSSSSWAISAFPDAVVADDRAGLPARHLGSAQGRAQHHDVDEGRRQAGLVHRGLRRPARRSRRLHRAPRARCSRGTAQAAPGTRTPRSAACTCARCST